MATNKLSDFRLESYEERSALQWALQLIQADKERNFHKAATAELLRRLSRTQCQPGGCEYCGDRPEPEPTCIGCGAADEESCECAQFDTERK